MLYKQISFGYIQVIRTAPIISIPSSLNFFLLYFHKEVQMYCNFYFITPHPFLSAFQFFGSLPLDIDKVCLLCVSFDFIPSPALYIFFSFHLVFFVYTHHHFLTACFLFHIYPTSDSPSLFLLLNIIA